MTFGHAIEAMRHGYRVSRPLWAMNQVWLELEIGPCALPFIAAVYNGERTAWPAPHDDLLATDWLIPGSPASYIDHRDAL